VRASEKLKTKSEKLEWGENVLVADKNQSSVVARYNTL